MTDEERTYEEHIKKASRTRLVILIILLCVVAVLGGIFLFVACRYQKTDLSVTALHDEAFTLSDGFLFPTDPAAKFVASYDLNTGEIREYEVSATELEKYGLSGTFSTFFYRPSETDAGRIVPADEALVPLSRANTDTRFVYRDADGKKYLIDTSTATAAPLFAGSTAEGVDEYAADVTEFSYGGKFALGVAGKEVKIYQRDGASFAIAKVLTVMPDDDAEKVTAFFCAENFVQIITYSDASTPAYYICDARSGEVHPCPNEWAMELSGPLHRTGYSQIFAAAKSPEDASEDTPFTVTLLQITLGKKAEFTLPDGTASAEVAAVSPSGAYACFFTQSLREEEICEEYLICRAGGKCVSLEKLVPEAIREEETVEDVLFLADNIVLLDLSDDAGNTRSIILKVCY